MNDCETLAAGRFLSLVKEGRWEYATRNKASGVVHVVPVTDDGKLIFVEQFRPPVGRKVIEFPAGLAGDIQDQEDEALETAAARELEEETGYQAREYKRVFHGPTSAGLCDEIATIFLAHGLAKVADGGGVGGEDITVHEVPLDQTHAWLEAKQRDGFYVAARVYTGLYFLQRNG